MEKAMQSVLAWNVLVKMRTLRRITPLAFRAFAMATLITMISTMWISLAAAQQATFDVEGIVKSKGIKLDEGGIVFQDKTEINTKPDLDISTTLYNCNADKGRITAQITCTDLAKGYDFCALTAMGKWNDPDTDHWPYANFSCQVLPNGQKNWSVTVWAQTRDSARCAISCFNIKVK